MPSRYETFDRGRLRLFPLGERRNLVDLSRVLAVGEASPPFDDERLGALAEAIASARRNGSAVIMMMGAHVIKQGLSRHVGEMLRRGWLTLLATNGACMIHDYEMAMIGATSESVAENIRDGRFGHWRETGRINDIIAAGAADGLGCGEALGKHVSGGGLPHGDVSIYAAAYDAGVPATVHVSIGYDIIHQHPNFDGAAVGRASYRDFLIFARQAERLEGGVLLCFGSAVMGPEVYLKALSMARNAAASEGREIRRFTSAVFDLADIPAEAAEEPASDRPEYYYRPLKTILLRTVRDGGRSFYFRGDHRATIPALFASLADAMR
jgi:hypothetical protein